MSASIYWQPVSPKKHNVDCGAPSRFTEAMRRAFGDRDVFGQDDMPILRGMMAAGLDGAESLIDALNQHDTIRLIVEW